MPADERGPQPLPGREPTNRLRSRRPAPHAPGRTRDPGRATACDVDVRRPLQELSVGVQQTVAVARAVNERHRVVVMDEPTSSLEPREVERLFSVIDLLRARASRVIYVSHRLDEVFRICDTRDGPARRSDASTTDRSRSSIASGSSP